MMTSPQLVLFDIDGTLLPKPGSEPRFALWLLRRGQLGPRQLCAYLWFMLRHWPRHGRHVMQKNKAYLSGLTTDIVGELAARFVREQLTSALYSPALERLQSHCRRGDHVVLLSGTPQFIATALADALGVAGACGALCAVRSGRFTAEQPLRHPYAKTKVDAARGIAEQAGLPLEQALAYGDSINDAWLFGAVGQAIVVMPDAQLRAMAAGRNWAILSD